MVNESAGCGTANTQSRRLMQRTPNQLVHEEASSSLRIGSRLTSSDIVFLPGLGGGMAVSSIPGDVGLPTCWDFQKTRRAVLYIVRLLRINRYHMRLRGQACELRVDIPAVLSEGTLPEAFASEHMKRFEAPAVGRYDRDREFGWTGVVAFGR